MRALATLLAAGLLGCHKGPPLDWTAPASSGMPAAACQPADPELATPFEQGQPISAEQVAALFPDLNLHTAWVAEVELRSFEVLCCGSLVVLVDPELRFRTRRHELLDVAVITDTMVHPRNILSLQREALHPPPPTGAWLAPDRTTLRHVGPVVVGQHEPPPRPK
jgi:hypothetical protein